MLFHDNYSLIVHVKTLPLIATSSLAATLTAYPEDGIITQISY